MVRRGSPTERVHAPIRGRLPRLGCAAWWVRLAGVTAASLVLMGSSTALAAGVWSPADSVDPAINAQSESCSSASFCVAVGFTSGFGSAAVYSDGAWSEASLIDTQSQLFSVSCPASSTSFCMAMNGDGEALTYNGSTWSAPAPTGADLTSVSCSSASFCVAVGGSGEAAVYNGSTWTAPTEIGSQVSSISCTSESFCMAVGAGNGGAAHALTYNGSKWSTPSVIDSQDENGLHTVSCASSSFCVTAGNFGDELTYDGVTWTKPTQLGILGYIQSVSCHSESFCVAATPEGETATYSGSAWAVSSRISEQAASGALSCPTESFCVAVGGYASTYNGGAWTSPVPVGGGGLGAVSCSSSSFCSAVDFHGRMLAYDGTTWSAPTQIDPEGGLDSVSCPSAVFCVAAGGGQQGYALTSDGSAWSAPRDIDPEGGVRAVSCASTSFCMAVTEHTVEGQERGYALTYRGGAWAVPSEIDAEAAVRSVSCPSDSFCAAVGGHDAVIYDGSSWSTPTPLYAEGSLKSVSCSSSTFCVAIAEHFSGILGPGANAQALTYNGSGWSAPSEIPSAPDRGPFDGGHVSCASSSFCLAAALFEGATAIFENGLWSAWMPLEFNGQFSSVSCPSASFCALVNEAGQAFTYSAPSTAPSTPGGGGSSSAGGSSGGGGVLGTQTALVSSAQIKTLLARELTPSGKGAKIAAVLKDGGFGVRFKVLEAGAAVIDWYEVPAGAKLAKKAKPKPVLVGAGQRTFTAAGTATIKIKLTAVGKNLLRHARQLRLRRRAHSRPPARQRSAPPRRLCSSTNDDPRWRFAHSQVRIRRLLALAQQEPMSTPIATLPRASSPGRRPRCDESGSSLFKEAVPVLARELHGARAACARAPEESPLFASASAQPRWARAAQSHSALASWNSHESAKCSSARSSQPSVAASRPR